MSFFLDVSVLCFSIFECFGTCFDNFYEKSYMIIWDIYKTHFDFGTMADITRARLS